eukprot:c9658_g1_i2.p1 GENE.c9658_g1_i2~~c9658_g1_i2.p1  ORF type:complete len:101 (+),score=29.59 c9658_g1_i2:65-367(+)
MSGATERIEMFVLNFKTIPAALTAVLSLLDLGTCDNTNVAKEGDQTRKHTYLGAAVSLDNSNVLCIANFAADSSGTQVHLRLCVRSTSSDVCDAVIGCMQ